MTASETAPRVALLARAGEACDRISLALGEAGAEVVLVADPLQAEPERVHEATPEAILVALDAAIEDALDRYADVLGDPRYMVIFEEAEQAAQRTGWDAARWLRHLSAKLHRHQDVLPAGAEPEDELELTPGAPAAPRMAVDLGAALEDVTGQAQRLADDVPSDSGLDGLTGRGREPATWQATPADSEPVSETLSLAPLDLDTERPLDTGDGVQDVQDGRDDTAAAFDPDATFAFGLVPVDNVEAPDADAEAEAFDELAYDPERFGRALQSEAAPVGIDEFLAAQRTADEEAAPVAAAAPEAPRESGAGSTTGFTFSGLGLVDDDAPLPPPPASAKPGPVFDLDALGSSLSLADPDSYGHGRTPGVVLVEAGLGGPDAVRQLLAALSEAFPRPILIHLPLEGGRYDRLVKQMTRATTAPVCVAEDGQPAAPGSVYFVPPGLGVRAVGGGWTFATGAPRLPTPGPATGESAVVMLSGADPARVPELAGDGTLLLAQTPDEGCYDPAAAQAAIAMGAPHAAPADLAALLLARWAGPDPAADADSSGLQLT